jgi:amino acid adenylation domain-containing protein
MTELLAPPAGVAVRRVARDDETERAVARVWAAVLGVDEVGAEDGFVALGGHSLAALQVVSRLRAELGATVPLAALLGDGTVASVAAALRARAVADDEPALLPVRRGGELPLSSGQERVWLLTQLAPESRAYHAQWALRVHGALDAAALEGALGDLVARHEIFRTSFHEGPAGPVQRIHAPAPVALPLVDLSAEAEPERALAAWMEAELARPFDPGALPLVRWTLLRLAPAEHRLVMVEHHLVHDGWSLNVFLRDLLACYRARLAGASADLPPLAVQYADYAAWQRRWLESGAARAQLAYWTGKLAGSPPPAELPTDRPRSAVPRHLGAAPRFRVPGSLAERLRQVARDEGATPFMVMMAAFAALLARLSGEREVCVGTGAAARPRREVEDVIGMFVNNLVLRLDLGGDPSFRALLDRARGTLLEAYAHQDVPFDAVVEAVHPDRGAGRNPLFQAMFSFHDSPRPALDLPGASARLELALANGSSKFDLNVVAIPGLADGGVELVWEYDSDLFDAATMERTAARYLALLSAVAGDPEVRLSRIPLLLEGERRTVVEAWNDTARPYPRGASIPALFDRWVARTPDALAVAHGGERVSYAELEARANRLAHHLRALGVRAEAPVAVLLDRGVDFVVACLAALKAGGAYLPVDTAFATRRVETMLAEAGAKVLVSTRPLADGIPTAGAALVRVDADAAAIAARPALPLRDHAHPESAACLLFTAGSGGRPRRVAVTHRGVARLAFGGGPVQPDAGDRVAHATGVALGATGWDVWAPLLNGAAVVVVDRRAMLSPATLARVLDEQRVTSLFLPTPFFAQVAREAPGTFAGVRDVLFGGQAADADAVRRVLSSPRPPRRLANVYGTAETTSTALHVVDAVPLGAATVPVGRPAPNTHAYVLDGGLEPVPPGCAGELYVGGDGVARGYPGDAALTARWFVPDPFSATPGARMHRTGDRARWTARGELEFLGRLDDGAEVGRARVDLPQVEAVLRAHPAVADAAAAVREDRPGHRRLVAYFVPAGDAAPDVAALRSHARLRLPEHMVPAAFVALARIPRDAVGAVDRRALPAPGAAAPATAAAAQPRTELERRIAALWAEVLEVERVGVDDSFFDLGGHSLLLMRLHARLAEMAPGLTVLDLFTHPTVASLCALIRGQSAPGAAKVSASAGSSSNGDGAAGGDAARLDAGRERLRARRRISEGA